MAVPKKRTTPGKQGRRRSHQALAPANLTQCANCKKPALPHRACPHCGWYRGRAVIKV